MRALIILISFSILQVNARELEVINHNLVYQLKFEKKEIAFLAQQISLSINRTECNAHIIDHFLKKMDQTLDHPFQKISHPEFIEIKLDKTTGYEPRRGERAAFLLSMYQMIKKIKIEEELNCSNKK